jgi:hypothetical protein
MVYMLSVLQRLGRARFTPVTTCLGPDDKPELGRGGAFERHWQAGDIARATEKTSHVSSSLMTDIASSANFRVLAQRAFDG